MTLSTYVPEVPEPYEPATAQIALARKQDVLSERFGPYQHYEESMKKHYALETFDTLENHANRTNGRHELARQHFLKIYGQYGCQWLPTSRVTDKNVHLARLYRRVSEYRNKYVAFMKIEKCGLRGKRQVPVYMELSFHLLIGKALLIHNKRPKYMSRGSHVSIEPGATFWIRCVSEDQAAVFVFSVTVNRDLIRSQQEKFWTLPSQQA